MVGSSINGRSLKADEMTEEQRAEVNLYARWRISKECKILEEYAGKPIEEVPEEYREKIAKLRSLGIGGTKKKIKAQNLGKATFTAGEDGQAKLDDADATLKEAMAIAKTKEEGGVALNVNN